jgi:signal transduction histidine kinase
VEELRSIPLIADLPEEELAWLAQHGEVREYAAGDIVFNQGDPADTMYLLLSGEVYARRPETGDEVVFRAEPGDVTGKLPFSRMTTYAATGHAAGPVRGVFIHERLFPEMLRQIPALEQRLIGVMTDRVRETTRMEEQREKFVALGRLSAGLAHELNNPAAAARRAAAGLQEALADAQLRTARIAARGGPEKLEALERHLEDLQPALAMDPLARSDAEDEVAQWLEDRGLDDAWSWAPTLVEGGVGAECLANLTSEVPEAALPDVLGWLEATLRTRSLLHVVEDSTTRISELVGAVKSYTYMDQASTQEVDVNQGLESTLAILGHKLRGVRVVREYAPGLPHICAYGSALNQVWTNLLDNAADAAGDGGEIRIRTSLTDDAVCVEITDSGPGIPPENIERIWDPFFTTKAVGQGTGLGLDIVRRIVARHEGDVRVTSTPGSTRFSIRLPLQTARGR